MLLFHPAPGEDGARVPVCRPTVPSPADAWLNPQAAATYSATSPSNLPASLNGIPFTKDALGELDWPRLQARYAGFREPPLPATQKRFTSGCVIAEADSRIWIVHPTNRYADADATFPKGRLELGLTLLVNAIKETWEESGLIVEPVSYLCDVDRTKTVTRYYLARRIGGSPESVGWESQAVSLVPPCELLNFINRPNDRKVIASLSRLRLPPCAQAV